MKSLILMRHAKAKSEFPGTDIDRPLTKSGKLSVAHLFPKFKSFLHDSPVFYVSISTRTKQTMAAICEAMGKVQLQLSIETNLYHASLEELLSFIKNIEGNPEQIILIGHNPGLNMLVENCMQADAIHFPPASFCVIESNVENWHDFNLENNKVVFLYQSK